MVKLFIIGNSAPGQNIRIGTDIPNPSAALEIKASTKGLLIPRTSTSRRQQAMIEEQNKKMEAILKENEQLKAIKADIEMLKTAWAKKKPETLTGGK